MFSSKTVLLLSIPYQNTKNLYQNKNTDILAFCLIPLVVYPISKKSKKILTILELFASF
jgi:hypothetical protein